MAKREVEFNEIILPPFKVKEDDEGDYLKFAERLCDSSGFIYTDQDGNEVVPLTWEEFKKKYPPKYQE